MPKVQMPVNQYTWLHMIDMKAIAYGKARLYRYVEYRHHGLTNSVPLRNIGTLRN
ncbi:MAG: hypothetical protein IKE29_05765 [Paenibacillus sp.]|uniref:hypothetical protein n=1 Tax=Paenibacillus sp. TaxID=58172 RepID=UPI0025FA8B9D|nr:hypothetical protein [Paenibacillus sp.]MBR2564111.1 hypothetical protein [Paenibacillus sp.]